MIQKAHNIDLDNIYLLEAFLSNAGNTLKYFRYYEKRSLMVVTNHLITEIITIDGFPACYGHLYVDKEVIWLGIAVSEKYRNQKLGTIMMNRLLDNAKKTSYNTIKLSVDNDNIDALRLYEKYGFVVYEKTDDRSFLRLIFS